MSYAAVKAVKPPPPPVQSLAGYTAKIAILFSCCNAGSSLKGGLLFDNSFLEPLPFLFQRGFETIPQMNSM